MQRRYRWIVVAEGVALALFILRLATGAWIVLSAISRSDAVRNVVRDGMYLLNEGIVVSATYEGQQIWFRDMLSRLCGDFVAVVLLVGVLMVTRSVFAYTSTLWAFIDQLEGGPESTESERTN